MKTMLQRLLALTLTVIFTTIALSAELLTNPGFENGTTGWSQSGQNSWIQMSDVNHSGAKSANVITWDDTDPYSAYRFIWQSISHNGSNEYTFSIYVRDNWPAGHDCMFQTIILKLEYYDANSHLLRTDQRSTSLAKDYQWHQYFLTGTNIPAGTASIHPVIGATQNDQWGKSILFDDASLTGRVVQTPPPHTGDLNNNLWVNFDDFALLAAAWMQTTDWDDLYSMADNWLTNYSASTVTIVPSGQTIEKYGYVFFDINSTALFSNPYNPNDVRVDIIFKDPNNLTITLPCFYVSGSSGNSHWQGRWTPRKTGQYSYQAKVYTYDMPDAMSGVSYLTVTDSNKDGFIRLNPSSYYSLKFDSGKIFRGIGEDVAWELGDPNYDYENMFPRLSDSNCNFARVLICHWSKSMPLEWCPGLGWYDETAATRLDTILSLAEQNGIYIMLTLDNTTALSTLPNYWGSGNYWSDNPYNAANNGPCVKAAAFFTNSAAKDLYKKKLRYIIARWGYNQHISVIELYNEIDAAYQNSDINAPAADIVSWHSEMSAYLKSIDPYGHLVSTSIGYNNFSNQLWNLSNIDISQTHPYGSTNSLYNTIYSFTTQYNKPYITGEFGYGWKGPGTDGSQTQYERELRMGLWRGMFSPTPVVPITWWWNSFAQWNDWYIFKAAAGYCSQLFPNGSDALQQDSASTDPNIEIMSLRNGTTEFVWMRNKTTSTLSGKTLYVYSLTPGTYEVRYYDTLAGTYSSPTYRNVTSGTLQSSVPSLPADKDIACRIVKTD